VACPDYKVGNKHTVMSLQELLQTTGQVGQTENDKPKVKLATKIKTTRRK
jgi:hypothetical protein